MKTPAESRLDNRQVAALWRALPAPAARERLILCYQGMPAAAVRAVSRRLPAGMERADLVQVVMVEMIRMLDGGRFGDDESFRRYAWVRLRGQARDEIQRFARRRQVEVAEEAAEIVWAEGASPDPETLALSRAGEVETARELGALPAEEAEILRLYYWQGMTVGEIGRVVKRSQSVVSMRHRRALAHLRHLRETTAARETRETKEQMGCGAS